MPERIPALRWWTDPEWRRLATGSEWTTYAAQCGAGTQKVECLHLFTSRLGTT